MKITLIRLAQGAIAASLLLTALPASAQFIDTDAPTDDMPNAAGAAAFSIGPDGTVYGAAVAASVSDNTAFAESRNAAGVSTARAFGSDQTLDLSSYSAWEAPTDEGFDISEVGGGLGVVRITVTGETIVVDTEPFITEEDVAAAEDAAYGNGYGVGYGEGNVAGYTDGYDTGYGTGTEFGYGVGYGEGLDDGFDSGYSTGYGEGYGVGYGDGFTDGSTPVPPSP